MRRLTYYVACTVDGFIAREDGSLDFFPAEGEHLADLFDAFPETVPTHLREALGVDGPNKRFDVVLMGRKTYEVGLDLGITSPYGTLKQYLVSRSMTESPDPDVELVREGVVDLVRELKKESGKDIWLCGGGQLAATLVGEIDELIIKLNPVILGSGTPLFAGAVEPTAVELTDRKIYDNGFMRLHYRLKRG